MRIARFALALLLGLPACDPSGSDWVARIDGTEIPRRTLVRLVDERVEIDPQISREDALGQELNRLVSEQIVLNRAAELGIEIRPGEAETRLVRIHGSDFADSDPAYLEEVRRQMVLDRTALVDLGERLRVPEEALLTRYEESPERYALPERVSIRQIVVPERERAERLLERLEDGGIFASLAGEHSQAPEAGEGGLLPPFARGELPEAFDRAFELSPGQISQVVESPYGFHIFKLEQRFPAAQPGFEELREQIRVELEQERLEELRREWLRGLRRRADISVNERLLEELR